ncbi:MULTISPECIES: NYN domain-containing protein [Vibrio]|uniref:Nuclease n=2 Tax=Vibrio TaxID=662 RepID=A0A0A5I477_PHOS4|nr:MULTISPECIES: NYN domain-containing protein [Vibrio]KGY10661.1 nuclease [Vibrio sinaloensis]KHD26906.1 nuclease [Vibrio caribbeanicus]KHT38751.1 nuclease [Vibrio sinaloensis]KIE20660.1 nuclease [Vibrio sinaloensis]
MEKIAIFVDVQNIYYTTRDKYRANFDYNEFWYLATEGKEVVEAKAYAIASTDPKQRQFHHILRGIGFDVKLKPYIQRSDGSTKGDWDVGIALDVYEAANKVDRVILLSGDGDFEILVERIQQRFGTKVDVYSVPGLTAQALIDVCDKHIPIEENLLLRRVG